MASSDKMNKKKSTNSSNHLKLVEGEGEIQEESSIKKFDDDDDNCFQTKTCINDTETKNRLHSNSSSSSSFSTLLTIGSADSLLIIDESNLSQKRGRKTSFSLNHKNIIETEESKKKSSSSSSSSNSRITSQNSISLDSFYDIISKREKTLKTHIHRRRLHHRTSKDKIERNHQHQPPPHRSQSQFDYAIINSTKKLFLIENSR